MEDLKLKKVSVCVAQYNRALRIKESIGSLINQSYQNLEVVVVNDGSPDPSVQAELESLKCSRLKIIEQKNTGFVKAIKNAISQSDGEFIYIHGAGDYAAPELIESQVEFLTENPNLAGVGCYYDNVDFDHSPHRKLSSYTPSKTHLTIDDFKTIYNPLGQGGTMYRREVYEAAGGYRNFFKFAQDHDLWLRMAEIADWAILPKTLYSRGYFAKDGVVTNVDKIIYQKALQEFAIQLSEERRELGKDSLDMYGEQSALLRVKTRRLSNFYCWKALCLLYSGDATKAQRLSSIAVEEMSSLKSNLVNFICKLSCNPMAHKLTLWAMRKHPKNKKWAM